MNFVNMPNLPEKPVACAVVDGRISKDIEKKLHENGILPIKTFGHTKVYEAISYHPDIMLYHIEHDLVIYAPGTCINLLGKLSNLGFKLIKGASELSPDYPADIAYNAVRVGGFIFCNSAHTDPVLMAEAVKRGLEPVNVRQGYAKCSISVIDEKSIITADAGIAKAAEKKGLDVLLLDNRQNIILPGMDYGFIGGSSGLIDKNRWAVYGDAKSLSSYKKIYDFLSIRGIEIISLSKGPVVDYGSILPLMTL